MKYSIREIGPNHFEESAKVIREAFQTVADDFGFTVENNPSNGAFLKPEKLQEEYEKGIRMFGLYAEGQQVGFAAVEKNTEELYFLEKLAVLPQHRRHGGGRQLLDYAEEYVRMAGGRRISIAVINENTRLKDWYQRYGFQETSLKKFDHLSFTVCFMELSVK